MKSLTVLLLLSFFFPETKAQDSLYLVGTITGESSEKRITNISRVGDVNGDGYNDFMIASRTGLTRKDQGIVQLYLGSSTLDLTLDVTFHYPCCDSLNNLGNASEIGDVNGDGYDDFAISGTFGDWGFVRGKVFIYYGGETIDTIPAVEFYENTVQDYFGSVVEELGDLNKDGYDDFAICSSYNWTDGKGHVYLFLGGDSITWDNSLVFTSDIIEDSFGESVTNIGDVNFDGFKDIAIGAPNDFSISDTSKVYIYFGGLVIDNIIDHILYNGSIFNIGDINYDNKIEFILYNGTIRIYSGLDSLISFACYLSNTTFGDLNKDGYDDFIIGYTNHRNNDSLMVGGAFIYLGGENIDTTSDIKIEGENKWGEFLKIMACEDINWDGFDELFILSPKFPDYENPKGKVYIYSKINFTDIENSNLNPLSSFTLKQNYPNPFNPSTNIQYSIATRQFVTLKVYNVLGKEIATLVNEEKPAGNYEIKFDASKLASGIYYYQMRVSEYVETKKMILLK